MKTKLLLFVLVASITSSCYVESLKAPDVVVPKDPSFDFPVPEGFDWSMHEIVDVDITIADQFQGRFDHAVEIYDGEILLDKGFLPAGTLNYTTKITKLRASDTLSVHQINPKDNRTISNVVVDNKRLVKDFSSFTNAVSTKAVSNSRYASADAPTIELPDDLSDIPEDGKLEEGEKYLIPDDGKTYNNLTLAKEVELYIQGDYEVGHMDNYTSANKDEVEFYIFNTGKLTTYNGSFALCESMEILNLGEISLTGNFELNEDNYVENYGTINVGGALNVYKGSDIDNHHFFSAQSAHFKGDSNLENSGSFKINEALTFDKSDYEGKAGSFISGNSLSAANECDFEMNAYSMVKVTGGSTTFSNSSLEGGDDDENGYAVLICEGTFYSDNQKVDDKICISTYDPGTYITGNRNYGEDVHLGTLGDDTSEGCCCMNIPSNEYNDGGFCNDTPTDPGEGEGGETEPTGEIEYNGPTYLAIIEDNFPGKGDLDMNDIVIKWRVGTLKDEQNRVSKIQLDLTIMAMGATKNCAGAIRIKDLPVSSATISKPHRFGDFFRIQNGLELGHTDCVVVPLYEYAYEFFGLSSVSFVNTIKGDTYVDPYNFKVDLELTNPISSADITLDKFDFFIVSFYNPRIGAREEVHIFGGENTIKATTDADFTKYDQIWGLQFADGFSYPNEWVSIKDAYPGFQKWVENSGTTNKEWYSNPKKDKVYKLD